MARFLGTCLVVGSVVGAGGCATVKKLFSGSGTEEAEAEEKKAVESAVAQKDLSKLKTECTSKKETTAPWCSGYHDVVVAELAELPCESAYSEYTAVRSATGASHELTVAMAESLARCEAWETYFADFLPSLGGGGVKPVGERMEAPFLARVTSGGALEPIITSTILDYLYTENRGEGTAATCEDYLAGSESLLAHSEYLGILIEKKCASAVPLFEAALLSEYGYVRAQACAGLGKFGEAKHLKLLENLAWTDGFEGENYSMPVREACRDAYGKLDTRLSL